MKPAYPEGNDAAVAAAGFLSDRSLGIRSPEILRIAGEVRAMMASGEQVFDLTVGDFDPGQFPPPRGLVDGVARHLAAGRTDYPPANGIPQLRRAVSRFYERDLKLSFTEESVLVGCGARPLIYAVYASTLAPGDLLVYAVPSWNNEYYAYLNGAETVVLEGRSAEGFLPRCSDFEPFLSKARVVHLNNPLNPSGTVMARAELEAICEGVVRENRRRSAAGEKSLVLLYDMVYWPLVYGESRFEHPISLVPEIAPWVVSIDAVSKWMAATGVRVGWAVVPPYAQAKIRALGSHMGAWAPHAEQHAVADVLEDEAVFGDYLSDLKAGLEERLQVVWKTCENLASEGFSVEAIQPQGAIYLSVKLDLAGGRTPQGSLLESSEEVRKYLLQRGGVGLIPFGAFGSPSEDGWFRVSVAASSIERLREAMASLAEAVRAVRR